MLLSLFHQINRRRYIKKDTRRIKKVIRLFGLGLLLSGLLFGGYFFFPFISWKLYIEPVFANSSLSVPIPKANVITQGYIQGLWLNTARSIQTLYDPSSQNWIPSSPFGEAQVSTQISYYFISIPKLKIINAVVSTIDTDLSSHLVNFPGTAIPPNKGNAAIFGHSTLPPLFDPKNYKTIFATAHNLVLGDDIIVTSNHKQYIYKIKNITITDPTDTSYLSQEGDESSITIVTCTPPGTLWKRLVIKARLENI